MTDKPKTLGELIREAIQRGEVGTDREAVERLGLTDFAKETGIKLVDREEIRRREEDGESSVVVCAPVGTKTQYTDNLTGNCIECGGGVIYRPIHSPDTPKVCMKCAFGDAI